MQENLAELMSSRICHDLISPVGAIGNGLELMGALSGPTPELELIGQSAHTAEAKLKFFRVAFGASGDSLISGTESQRIAAEMFATGRFKVEFSEGWGDRQRGLVKLFYLLLLCVETSLPKGGVVTCSPTISGWRIEAKDTPVGAVQNQWAPLLSGGKVETITAKTIQFALAQESLQTRSIKLKSEITPEGLFLSF